MGVLDAAECPPTFNTDRVVGVMAGSAAALERSREAAEDDAAAGAADLAALAVTGDDAVVGIAASGRTPYTIGAVRHAAERRRGDGRHLVQPGRRAEPRTSTIRSSSSAGRR